MTSPSTTPDVRVTGRRIVATLIDGVVFGVFNGLLAWVTGSGEAWWEFDLTSLSTSQNQWLFVVAALYYIVLEGLTGRTAGKLITGIRVVDAQTGAHPGLLSGVVRTLLRLIDGIAGYLVALIVVVNSKNRRRLGDMAAKTLVVRV
ncbi:RDD family protein [Actinoplanes sp. NPDC049316]|uniref:RDD family protein n=1 Tax=Actinoplanes sp. NPDC049316 TaxID=3154727 RepID=UPI00341DB653